MHMIEKPMRRDGLTPVTWVSEMSGRRFSRLLNPAQLTEERAKHAAQTPVTDADRKVWAQSIPDAPR